MMGIVKPETCSAYKKCNKIIMASSWFFYSSIITMMHGPINIRYIQLGFWLTNFHLTLFKDPITFTNEGVHVLASSDSTDLSGSKVVRYKATETGCQQILPNPYRFTICLRHGSFVCFRQFIKYRNKSEIRYAVCLQVSITSSYDIICTRSSRYLNSKLGVVKWLPASYRVFIEKLAVAKTVQKLLHNLWNPKF